MVIHVKMVQEGVVVVAEYCFIIKKQPEMLGHQMM